uniref:Putative mannosyltransferase n=1 Tax=Coprinellus disseminatus TaxID=71703 RepID=Q1WMR4_COPDI|nr:putative mannosyltransferase [Coprinellus disseminatus]
MYHSIPQSCLDDSRQVCSGMWGGSNAYINVTVDSASQGQVALVIYEWKDVQYLGKTQRGGEDQDLPIVYVCTAKAFNAGYCAVNQLGRFILDLPAGKGINETSFWSERVQLPANKTVLQPTSIAVAEFWNNPAGNPTPPASNYSSPWRRDTPHYPNSASLSTRQTTGEEKGGVYEYDGPIHYPVANDGFYCVAIVPITGEHAHSATDLFQHPSYHGDILFQNVFNGHLAAADYPKLTFYFVMFLCYVVVGAVWGWLSYRHLQELFSLQYYLSGLIGLLVIEMLATWVYYRYLNARGPGTASTVFLIVVAILDAGRNSMSFFLLLIVSLGLGVVRESLGRTMIKCQVLAVCHFIFGVIYAIGIVELELESTSALMLLLFIIPLAFTLSGFLLWIMYALNGTIQQLEARKQHYKLRMFKRLHYILYFVVLAITIFFFISSMSFSGRGQQGYAANTWRTRWWLLDGFLAILYFVVFCGIAYLCFLLIFWAIFTLAMSDELAQDEEDAEDYDLEAIQSRTRRREEDDDDDRTLVGGRRGGHEPLPGENVVFDIGDDDEDDDDDAPKKPQQQRKPLERHSGDNDEYRPVNGRNSEERQDLMSRARND